MPRSRTLYLFLAGLVVIAGLASRQAHPGLPPFIGMYAGDTLWAAMVFLLAAALWRDASLGLLTLAAVLFSSGVELSQLYHAPWIRDLRATRVGALVLGQGFLWSDLLCYSVGIGIAAAVDFLLRSRAPAQERPASV